MSSSTRRMRRRATPPQTRTFRPVPLGARSAVVPARPRPARSLGTVPAGTQRRISDAVHRAVIEVKGTDRGQCMSYALAGTGAVYAATGVMTYIQVGSLQITYGEPGGDDGGRDAMLMSATAPDGGMENGEFHAWLGHPDALIDFSTRHLVDAIEGGMEGEFVGGELRPPTRRRWERPERPPEWVWWPDCRPPDDVLYYEPDLALTTRVVVEIATGIAPAWARELIVLAGRYYRES